METEIRRDTWRGRRAIRIENISDEFKILLVEQAAGDQGDAMDWGEDVGEPAE